ncbi:MAG: DinB family protein [Acidobacteriota bacterium]
MNKALKRLDSTHQKLLDAVTPLSAQVFSRRPGENEWSVAEIVHHLRLVEERVILEMEKELSKPPRKLGILRRLIPTSITASRLIRVKAPKAVTPLEPPPKDENIAAFNTTRTKLKELCANHGQERLRQMVFNHPFLGQIDGTATVSFVGYHELRHYKQVREVLKKLGNSAEGAP